MIYFISIYTWNTQIQGSRAVNQLTVEFNYKLQRVYA